MRVSRASGQPGLPLTGAAAAVGVEPGVGSSTFGGTDDGVPPPALLPNNPGARCLVAKPALASSATPIRPLVSDVAPPRPLVVLVIACPPSQAANRGSRG